MKATIVIEDLDSSLQNCSISTPTSIELSGKRYQFISLQASFTSDTNGAPQSLELSGEIEQEKPAVFKTASVGTLSIGQVLQGGQLLFTDPTLFDSKISVPDVTSSDDKTKGKFVDECVCPSHVLISGHLSNCSYHKE